MPDLVTSGRRTASLSTELVGTPQSQGVSKGCAVSVCGEKAGRTVPPAHAHCPVTSVPCRGPRWLLSNPTFMWTGEGTLSTQKAEGGWKLRKSLSLGATRGPGLTLGDSRGLSLSPSSHACTTALTPRLLRQKH